jgi:hypothetical protein
MSATDATRVAAHDEAPSERAGWIAYDFAIVRVVPHVHLGAFVAAGVVMHARRAEFLQMRALVDPTQLQTHVPDVDAELLSRYLRAWQAVCSGDPAAGAVALAPPSERFHWLTAPRSDVLQCSPVHEGLCVDLDLALDDLFSTYVVLGV